MILFLLVSIPVAFPVSGLAGEALEIPQSKEGVLRQAFRASLRGDHDLAVQNFRAFLEQGGQKSSYMLGQYARSLAASDQMEQAIFASKEAMEMQPDDPEPLTLHAEILRKAGKLDSARELLTRALERFPDNGRVEFFLAETLYQDSNRVNDAIIHYRQLLFHLETAGPEAPVFRTVSLWRLGNIYLVNEQPQKASTYLIKYLKHNPDRLYARFVLGFHVYFKTGQYDKAMEQFRLIMAEDEKVVRAQEVDLYAVYTAAGRIRYLQDNAESTYLLKKALDLRPQDVLNRGLIFSSLGQYKRSMELLLKYAKVNPEDIFVRYGILKILSEVARKNPERRSVYLQHLLESSVIAGRKGQPELALELTRKAIAMKRDGVPTETGMSSLYELMASHYSSLEQYNRAALYMRLALREARQEGKTESANVHGSMRLRLAQNYALAGRSEGKKALQLLGEIEQMQESPSSTIHYIRGMIYLNQDRTDLAVEELSHAIEQDPDREVFYYYRAVGYHRLRQFSRAKKDLLRAIELKPDWDNALNYLGYLYAERSIHLDQAETMIQKAVESSPTNPAYQDSLGWLYYQKGDYEKARYHLNLAGLLSEEQKAEDPDIYEHLGDVYSRMGHPVRAVEQYRRAIFIARNRLKEDGNEMSLSDYENNRLNNAITRIEGKIDSITAKNEVS